MKSIGELSKETGCAIETIRYYEKIGLLSSPPRTTGGHRAYNNIHVRELLFILQARKLDFSIEIIRSLIRLSNDSDQPCNDALEIVDEKLMAIEKQIKRLTMLKQNLHELSVACKTSCHDDENQNCCIIENLDKGKNIA